MSFPIVKLAACALVLALAPPVLAEAPSRQSTLVIYGDDPCPQPTNDSEAVVCARRPESERYRIPRQIRERQPTETAWANRVDELEEQGRQMRPDSCSVVGSNGFTGCTQAMIRQWYAERRARRAQERSIP